MLSRRALLAASAGLAGTAGFVGCAGTGSTPTANPRGSDRSPFPVNVSHKYGTTTVPAAPTRVVSVGVTEQDPLLALGVVPVGVTEWYGDQPLATWSWSRPRYGTAKPTVLSTADGFQFEKIAGLAPDLIVGPNSGMTKADYAKFSAIAPTIANSGKFASDWFEPWTTQTSLIGDALGRSVRTRQLVEDVKAAFSTAAEQNPRFGETSVIFLQGAFSEGAAIASPAGLGTEFLTDLGLTVPDSIKSYVRDSAQAYIPLEKLDVLNDADVLIWAADDPGGAAERKKNPFYRRLAAVRAGRSVELDPTEAAASYFSTVLSLPFLLDALVGKVRAALAQ